MSLLEGRVAVVTGSGRGVGRAVALAFAEEGATVVVTARSRDEIEDVAEDISGQGGRALAIPADIVSQKDVDTLFGRVLSELGPVDILVNNAAIAGPSGMTWKIDPDAWQEMFNVNVTGMVRCARAVLPAMITGRYGKILIVGSVAGREPNWAERCPEIIAYGVSKAAANHFSNCLAAQVKDYGINVNCIGVGAQTRLSHQHRRAMAGMREQSPPPPWEELPQEDRVLPEENVAPFVFLASSLSDHITGQYIEANSLPNRLRRT